MRAIVTGADGFVGSYVVKELLDNDYQVLALDLSPTPHRLSKHRNLEYLPVSIDNISSIERKVKFGDFDYFFHFAWRGSAGPEREDEDIQIQNALETAKCLREAAKLGIKRFVMSGTIMEYETNEAIYKNGSQPGLPYIYGAGKVSAHLICKPIAVSLGIDLLWVNITNSYGPGETAPRLLNNIIRNVIEKKSLEFTSGTQNYDFVYVTDVARAFRLVAEKGIKNKNYLIGSGHAKPLKEFIIDALDVLQPKSKATFGNVPYTGAMTPLADFSIEEIKTDCGFEPRISFKEGVKKTYESALSIQAKTNKIPFKEEKFASIVTGADGFVGSHLVDFLAKRGMKVLAIDLPKTPKRIDLSNNNITYLSMSIEQIEDLEGTINKGTFSCFYHCAWKGSAGAERSNPDIQLENVAFSVRCLKEAAKLGCQKFIFLSTIGELESNQVTYLNGATPDPHYIYGACKATVHGICKSLSSSLGISLNWVYLTNIYGPGETTPKFINWLMDKTIMQERVELTSCEQLYDFVNIEDVSMGLALIGAHGFMNKEYILGSGNPRPLKDFLTDFTKSIPDKTTFVYGSLPYTGAPTPRSFFDISSSVIDLGYRPQVEWDGPDGIAKTYLWRKGAIANGTI